MMTYPGGMVPFSLGENATTTERANYILNLRAVDWFGAIPVSESREEIRNLIDLVFVWVADLRSLGEVRGALPLRAVDLTLSFNRSRNSEPL